MKEIKFRAWDKKEKEMLSFGKIIPMRWIYRGSLEDMFNNCEEDIEIMQFTGLKDKNGVEIYSGDIVKVPEHEEGDSYPRLIHEEIYPIEFEDGGYNIDLASILGFGIEVIGNIHENPKLLK